MRKKFELNRKEVSTRETKASHKVLGGESVKSTFSDIGIDLNRGGG